MNAFVAAGGGFLLAVLWFDLMFDVQARGHRGEALPEAALTSISTYYRRVVVNAFPMNRLIAAVMLATLAAIVVQIAAGDDPVWIGWTALALAVPPISQAAARTVPNAARLGAATDPPNLQSKLARGILRDHVLCFASIATLVAIELIAA